MSAADERECFQEHITQSVALALVVSSVILVALVVWGGSVWNGLVGLYVGAAAFIVGSGVQVAWLWKVQPVLERLERRDGREHVGTPLLQKR